MTAVRKKSKVPELNEAKLGLVKLADSGKQWLTITFPLELCMSKLDKDNFKKQSTQGWSEYPTRTTKNMS